MPGQRIGVMGGSFNPPHAGHVLVAEVALKQLGLDQLWWVVSPGNPLKAHDALPPQAERMAACRKLVTDPRIEVTGFEAALASPYTASTLAFLRSRFPATHFVWVMGADNLAQFHRWRNWRAIAASVPIAVIDRPGWHLKAQASPAARAMARGRIPEERATRLAAAKPPAWTFLTARLSAVSSTALRATARSQKPETSKEILKQGKKPGPSPQKRRREGA